MVRGMASAARVLRESEAGRALVQWLPVVERHAALQVGDLARGRPVPPDVCARILAESAVGVLTEGHNSPERAPVGW